MHNKLRRDLDKYLNHTNDHDIDPGDAARLCKQLLVRSFNALGGPVAAPTPPVTASDPNTQLTVDVPALTPAEVGMGRDPGDENDRDEATGLGATGNTCP